MWALADDSSRVLVQQLAELGDRSTGSSGCLKTANLIRAAFEELGLEDIGRHQFLLPVIQYQSAAITVAGREAVPIKPTRLNALSPEVTPDSGFEGPLYYVGTGELRHLNNKPVEGSIILMELDSAKNWLNAAMLGAKALVYVDRGSTTRGFFEDKHELTAIRFPRFWMSIEQAHSLFGSFETAPNGRVASKVQINATGGWRRVKGENIYGLIPGKDPQLAEELVIVEAFYDSRSFVAGTSPGGDEASSIVSLLHLARSLRKQPPGRSVLLLATSGHAQALAGTREFVWALRAKRRQQKRLKKELNQRIERAEKALAVLKVDQPLAQSEGEIAENLREALSEQIKTEVDLLSQRLMRLRLEERETADQELIRELADKRFLLRQLSWRSSYSDLRPEEEQILAELIPAAIDEHQAIMDDARLQKTCLKTSSQVRRLVGDKRLVTMISLHLSSHGDGIGAFNYGWLYKLRPRINRTQIYAPISRTMERLARQVEKQLDLPPLFHDTLRPNPVRPWRSYLPDHPKLGGEVSAIAGLLGLSLATVNDTRPFWGTPHDEPERIDWPYLEQQNRFVAGLISALSYVPSLESDRLPRIGFSTLTGRANFIRQGELFPDQPAPDTLILAYQGPGLYYTMVDRAGSFQIRGLADRKNVFDKAIIEAFRFHPNNGEIIWAIDKEQTGKTAYRVKMQRRSMETDLVMFSCGMTTIFDLLEPRTFRYMTKIKLIDARREAAPLRYWWSRIDTLSSTLANIYLEATTPFKLTLSDTVLNRKFILLNSVPSQPEGEGYRVEDWPIIPATEYQVAHDMWGLLGPRIKNLETHGIVNDRIRYLQDRGTAALAQAKQALQELRYDRFMEEARTSWALASRVYNDVERTQKDVLLGVLFYVALFVPFAYCIERLLFSFVDIHRRIVAFLVILGLVIGIIYLAHPAFQLTYSPLVVILAFFILGLSVMVAVIIIGRFEQEMVILQQRARQIKTSEISRTKAFFAAFVLGVSNLRRRPIRTILTCVTLIILTFTIMSFTTVKSLRYRGRLQLREQASYNGLLMRILNWDPLPPETLNIVETALSGVAVVAPRVWQESEDRAQAAIVSVRRGQQEVLARGVVGLSDLEPEVSGLDQILSHGRWFQPGEKQVVLLPERMVEQLGVSPEVQGADAVSILGMTFRVVGSFKGEGLQRRVDLDGEPLTPAIYPSEAAREITDVEMEAIEAGEDVQAFQSRYHHIPGDQTIIVPYQTLMGLGGNLKAIAARPQSNQGIDEIATRLVDRFGLTLFGGEPEGTFMYHASDALSYSGVPNIIIPILISVLIVLNTMIGSVYERKREIGVYTSVGLAPFHVAFLFIAEALAFAVLSVVLGYLLAQTSAALFATTWLWQGITVNYSSLAGVFAMILVILVVLVSVIYPSRVASSIAIPDVVRAWSLPEPRGNEIVLTLPFLMKYREQMGVGGYLREYYLAHRDVSHGLFATDDVSLEFHSPDTESSEQMVPGHDDNGYIQVSARVWLAPFDFGVKQLVHLTFHPAAEDPENYLEIRVQVQREAGEANAWKRINKAFFNDMRKQLLVWRSMDEEAQKHYERRLTETETA
jgi:hypothetical protein